MGIDLWATIRCMKRENAKATGSTLGKVEYIEESAKCDCHGRCIRVRININITLPLCRGRIVNMGGPNPRSRLNMNACQFSAIGVGS